MSDSTILARLHEVIAALDRRRPQPQRSDEIDTARQSADLRVRALARIAEIVAERPGGPGGPSS